MTSSRFAVRVSIIYLLVGIGWILVSDWISFAGADVARAYRFALLKGLCYVCTTALLLFLLIRRSFRLLGESEERFRVLAENAPDATFVLRERRVIYANAAAHKMLGVFSAEKMRERDLMDLIHPRFRDGVGACMTRVSECAESVVCQEIVFLRGDGGSIECEGTMVPILFDHASCVLVIARDLTDRKMAQEQMLNAKKMALVQQLAGGLAHELNNLTQVVNGNAELASTSLPPDTKEQVYLSQVLCAGQAIADWVARIMDFSVSVNPKVENLLMHSNNIAQQVTPPGVHSSDENLVPAKADEGSTATATAAVDVPLAQQTDESAADTVLFAEDDDLVCRLTERILKLSGYEVLVAKDGESAVALFDANAFRISAVLLDVIMPRMNGFEAYAKIHARDASVPVLFASGFKGYQTPEGIELISGVNFLAKPYNREELVSALQQAITKRKMNRVLANAQPLPPSSEAGGAFIHSCLLRTLSDAPFFRPSLDPVSNGPSRSRVRF